MNRRKAILLLSILLIMSCSESRDSITAKVPVEFGNTVNPLAEVVKSVEIVPLEADDEHLLGSSVDLNVTEDSYIVTDYLNGNIFRYSHDGRFLNNIGHRGNGPEEYVHINDVQYRDSTLYVFSVPSRIQRFSLSGSMLDLKSLNELDLGAMSWITDEGVLTYYGYGSGRETRFSLLSDETRVDFFPSKEKVMNYTPTVQIFSESGDSVFVVDSYSDIIKVYSKGLMSDGPCMSMMTRSRRWIIFLEVNSLCSANIFVMVTRVLSLSLSRNRRCKATTVACMLTDNGAGLRPVK